MKKSKRFKLISLIVLFMGIFSLCLFGTMSSPDNNVSAAGETGVVCTLSVDKSEIKNTDTDVVITLTVTVENYTGIPLYGAQVDIQLDPEIFEADDAVDSDCGLIKSPDIMNTYLDRTTNKASGYLVLCGDNNGISLIEDTKWIIASYKIKVKKAVADYSAITMSNDVVANGLTGKQIPATLVGAETKISFVEPSSECELTNLTTTQNGVSISKSGNDYVATVPYSVKTLNTANLKPTVSDGATVTYSPSGNVALNEGANTIVMTVTAEDGTTKKQVNFVVTRQAGETVKTLSSLTVKNGNNNLISKTGTELASGISENLGTIPYADRANLSIELEKNGTYSTVQILLDGESKYNGTSTETAKSLSLGTLTSGSHTAKIVVKSETGETTEYTLTFVVEEEPQGPTDPSNPDDPNNPNNPSNPDDPNNPSNPSNPSDPSNPDNPNKPNDPTNPGANDGNADFDLFPYILTMIIFGVDNFLALIVIIVLVARRKRR